MVTSFAPRRKERSLAKNVDRVHLGGMERPFFKNKHNFQVYYLADSHPNRIFAVQFSLPGPLLKPIKLFRHLL